MAKTSERPLVFTVDRSPLLGILHSPAAAPTRGIIMVAAGGPQYRAGCGRQLITWARQFAASGVAVLRFDYRGMGDSGGAYVGFHQIDDDLRAAVDELLRQHPTITDIALWGGCSAASATFIYAGADGRVTGLIALNPWAHTEAVEARIQVKHYYFNRLRQKSFWLKLLRGGLNWKDSAASMLNAVQKLTGKAATASTGTPSSGMTAAPRTEDTVERMRLGLDRYQGKVLLLLSGMSLIGREFDETVAASKAWQKTVAGLDLTRRELPDAGHTFATRESQDAVFKETLNWMGVRNG